MYNGVEVSGIPQGFSRLRIGDWPPGQRVFPVVAQVPQGKILLALCREASRCSENRDHPQNCSVIRRKGEDHRNTLPTNASQP